MSQTFKGDITNNVVELNLQAGADNIGTPTVAYDGTNNGEISVQVMGDVDEFSGFQTAGSAIKGLVIGTSCTTIGNSAFYFCSGLTGSLTIGNSVTSIGSYAFGFCVGFNGSLTIGNSVTSIESYAFSGCSGFNGSLTIPNSVTSIGSYAFSSCSGLTGSLTIPDSVTSIGDYAFGSCNSLTGDLVIPDSVTSIGRGSFSVCYNFTQLIIPSSNLTSIGDNAFGSTNDHVAEVIRTTTLSNARTVKSSYNFDLPENYYLWNPTCHDSEALKYLEAYLSLDSPKLSLFYVWGHSWELRDTLRNQNILKFCNIIGDRDDIWYTGAGNFADYHASLKALEIGPQQIVNPEGNGVVYYREKRQLKSLYPKNLQQECRL